jgi:hypothetical protein
MTYTATWVKFRLKEKSGGKFLRYRESNYPSGERHSEVWQLSREGWLAKRAPP